MWKERKDFKNGNKGANEEACTEITGQGYSSEREKGNGLPVTTCTEAPPQVCTTNLGGAPASSTATAVNPEDWKLLLERIQGFLDVKYCQKIKSKNYEPNYLGWKPSWQLTGYVTFLKVLNFLWCKMRDKNKLLSMD